MAHAKLSPSSAHRWLRCTASVYLTSLMEGEPETSVHAAEGTFCHDIAAVCLSNGMDAAEFIGSTGGRDGHTFTFDDEMAEAVQTYVDAIHTHSPGAQLYVEYPVDISKITLEEGATGTADCVAVYETPNGVCIDVHDLKMGRGVEVDAEGNEQLALYALGAIMTLPDEITQKVTAVRGLIHQPRINKEPKVAVFPPTDLLVFGATVKVIGARVAGGEHEFNPGEKQCRWCPAKASCPALAEWVKNTIGAEFSDLTTGFATLVTPLDGEALSIAMRSVSAIEDWCNAVRAEVERRLLAGESVDGFKLVMGRRGARKWSDEPAVARLLEDQLGEAAYTKSLLSVTAAEKALKKIDGFGSVAKYVTQSPGSPSVAPENDPRPEYSNAGVASAFSTAAE